LWTTITRSNTAHTGSFAAHLATADYMGQAILPFLQSNPFPVNEAHGSLTGYYQFQPARSSEVFSVAAWFAENSNLVGFGFIDIGTPASGYTQFTIPIEYFGDAVVVPDSAYIWIAIFDTSETDPVVGATGLVDDLSFGPPTSVKQNDSGIPQNFILSQNYPNPFNPSTKINFSIPEQSYVELIVYNILGNEVARLVNDNYSAGEYSVDFDASNLPSGIYVARINAGRYSSSIKMTLLK
jgi:hypothetical protein